jgi:hypothetical protein
MALTRKLRDGTIAEASTIYVPRPNAIKANVAAKKLKTSKSKVYVAAIKKEYPA